MINLTGTAEIVISCWVNSLFLKEINVQQYKAVIWRPKYSWVLCKRKNRIALKGVGNIWSHSELSLCIYAYIKVRWTSVTSASKIKTSYTQVHLSFLVVFVFFLLHLRLWKRDRNICIKKNVFSPSASLSHLVKTKLHSLPVILNELYEGRQDVFRKKIIPQSHLRLHIFSEVSKNTFIDKRVEQLAT